MTIRLVRMAITACPDCLTSYDLEEWRELSRVAAPTPLREGAKIEARICETCSAMVIASVEGLEDLNLLQHADDYAASFPNSDRPRRRGIEVHLAQSWRSRLAAVDWQAFAIVVVCLLAAMWLTLSLLGLR